MELTKYKITAPSIEGYLIVTYCDAQFKSVLSEFKQPLNDVQLNALLNQIPSDPLMLADLFGKKFKGRVTVELLADASPSERIAMFCARYEKHTGVKYKTSPAEVGKMKQLQASDEDLSQLMDVYFACAEWWAKEKSMHGFYKKYNEIRALAAAKSQKKTYPLPYDESFYNNASLMDKRNYHAYLRENGYRFEHNGRIGKWIKNETFSQNG